MNPSSRRRTRIQVLARSGSPDAAGQPSETWVLLVALWADVRLLSGIETLKAGAQTSTVSASMRIYYRRDIDAGMRVQIGSDVYQINAVLPDIAKHEHTDLVVELIK